MSRALLVSPDACRAALDGATLVRGVTLGEGVRVLGKGHALALLAEPVQVVPGDDLVLWLAWPLGLSVRRSDGVEVFRAPRTRRALSGGLTDGVVVAAAVCAHLEGPRDAPVEHAALCVRVKHAGSEPIGLRRVPFDEAALRMYVSDEHAAVGDVVVTILEGTHAEARTRPGEPIDGMVVAPEALAPAPRVQAIRTFDWVLDSGRRAVEFQL